MKRQHHTALLMATMLGGLAPAAPPPPSRRDDDDDDDDDDDPPRFRRIIGAETTFASIDHGRNPGPIARACGRCRAQPGEECRGRRGRYRFHRARVQEDR